MLGAPRRTTRASTAFCRGIRRRRRSRRDRAGCARIASTGPCCSPTPVRAALAPFLARDPGARGLLRATSARRALLTRALDPPREDHGARADLDDRALSASSPARSAAPTGAMPGLDLVVDPDARERMEGRRLRGPGGPRSTSTLVVVTPGASFGASKLWPPEHFARSVRRACRVRELGLCAPCSHPGPGEEAIAARSPNATSDDAARSSTDPVTGSWTRARWP